ncbi:MAG: glycosyltransferase, partial [Alphaproteobacteria bacterium]
TDFLLPRFGKFVAAHIRKSHADVLVGWSSAILEAIPVAQYKGIAVAVDRGAAHIRHQNEVLEAAYHSQGLRFPGISRAVIDRELAEYEAADRILVLSSLAAETFIENGVPAEKIAVVPLGVDSNRFRIRSHPERPGKPSILFVGTVGIQKGMPQLLRAFAPLSGDAELRLVGPVEPAFADLLTCLPTKGVTLPGAARKRHVAHAYAGADIFCLPSVQEGFGMVVLEAMASGLPVVVSDQVGAADLVSHGETGFVYPVQDDVALTEYLGMLAGDAALRRKMGFAARQAAESRENSWEAYVDRVVSALGALTPA